MAAHGIDLVTQLAELYLRRDGSGLDAEPFDLDSFPLALSPPPSPRLDVPPTPPVTPRSKKGGQSALDLGKEYAVWTPPREDDTSTATAVVSVARQTEGTNRKHADCLAAIVDDMTPMVSRALGELDPYAAGDDGLVKTPGATEALQRQLASLSLAVLALTNNAPRRAPAAATAAAAAATAAATQQFTLQRTRYISPPHPVPAPVPVADDDDAMDLDADDPPPPPPQPVPQPEPTAPAPAVPRLRFSMGRPAAHAARALATPFEDWRVLENTNGWRDIMARVLEVHAGRALLPEVRKLFEWVSRTGNDDDTKRVVHLMCDDGFYAALASDTFQSWNALLPRRAERHAPDAVVHVNAACAVHFLRLFVQMPAALPDDELAYMADALIGPDDAAAARYERYCIMPNEQRPKDMPLTVANVRTLMDTLDAAAAAAAAAAATAAAAAPTTPTSGKSRFAALKSKAASVAAQVQAPARQPPPPPPAAPPLPPVHLLPLPRGDLDVGAYAAIVMSDLLADDASAANSLLVDDTISATTELFARNHASEFYSMRHVPTSPHGMIDVLSDFVIVFRAHYRDHAVFGHAVANSLSFIGVLHVLHHIACALYPAAKPSHTFSLAELIVLDSYR